MIISLAEAKFNKKFVELSKLKEDIERQINSEIMQRTNRRVDRTEWDSRIANDQSVCGTEHVSGIALQSVR